MKFVRTKDLKVGMRLARPIYNKNGVLLFERDSKLSAPAIDSVRNFGLLGIYVLEPAEPVPPMTREDMEFERFQTMSVFSIAEEMNRIMITRKTDRIQTISGQIIKKYGHLEGKINFYQSLRSREDYVYKHSLNVAILCAMITHQMNVKLEEQNQTVNAAIVHDIGKIPLAEKLNDSDDMNAEEKARLYEAQLTGCNLIETAFMGSGVTLKRICMQAARYESAQKMVMGAKILRVANRYDEMTSMKMGANTDSEVQAVKELMKYPEIYSPDVVSALLASINILVPGVSVELSTHEKALVLVENARDILRPVVLCFKDNSIVDLSLAANRDIEVVDIMKTLDNRCIMDIESLRKAGF